MYYPLPASVLLGFERYLEIHIFSISQLEYESRKSYDQVLMTRLYAFLLA